MPSRSEVASSAVAALAFVIVMFSESVMVSPLPVVSLPVRSRHSPNLRRGEVYPQTCIKPDSCHATEARQPSRAGTIHGSGSAGSVELC